MKKKIGGFIFTIFTVFTLAACSSSIQEELQANDWNVVSTNGESYQASFNEDTITFDLTIFQLGYQYSIDEENDTLTWKEDTKSEPMTFDVSKNNDEFIFEAQADEVYDQYGNLTLTPIEEETTNQ